MREIKFRGKSVDGGDWVYGYHLYTFEIGYNSQGYTDVPPRLHYIFGNSGDFCEVDPTTVGQYTGLKDSKENGIWEGDIVENEFSQRDDFCYKVIWHEEAGQWVFDPFMKGDEKAPLLGIEEFVQDWETVGWDDETITVIGNIHDNPELLEVQHASSED